MKFIQSTLIRLQHPVVFSPTKPLTLVCLAKLAKSISNVVSFSLYMGNAPLIQQTSEPLCLLYNVANLRPVLLRASHGLNYPCTDAQAVSMMI